MKEKYPNRYKKCFDESALIGQIFGMLTVTSYSHCNRTKGRSTHYWKCVCECGKEKRVQNGHLKHGNTTSCGCNKYNLKHYEHRMNTPDKMLQIEKDIIPDGNGCKIWPYTYNAKGYGKITFNNKTCEPHRVIYICKHGPLRKNEVVRHLCGNKACISLSHLEKGTHKDNAQDAIRLKERPLGEHHPSAKLTWDQVSYIRKHESHVGTSELGRKYGVSHKTIERMLKGITWKE